MPRFSDLIQMGKQYVRDAMPGGLLNPETQPIADQARYAGGILDPDNNQIGRDLQAWHKRTQSGLRQMIQTPTLSDLVTDNPADKDYAYQQMMNMVGVAPVGMTAWHGSPHKFDKFSLDKIGTGEGAQAYGHGLYLAEKPEIAAGYRERLSTNYLDNSGAQKAAGDAWTEAMQAAQDAGAKHPDHARAIAAQVQSWIDSGKQAKTFLRYNQPPAGTEAQYKAAADALDGLKKNPGNLYKTDIPDEAVARFLDWDKPLSQQAPEVLAKARSAIDSVQGQGFYDEYAKGGADLRDLLYNLDEVPAGGFENLFKQQGIPGIRYLDGGSRSAGQGSSNFVAFDPEMIRIIERNGIPTGQKPWNPNEYRPMSDLMNPRID